MNFRGRSNDLVITANDSRYLLPGENPPATNGREMPSARDVDTASAHYEEAERRYLSSVQAAASEQELGVAASALADAAASWSKAAYQRYFALGDDAEAADRQRGAEIQAEIAETLSELWRDVASAHAGSWAPSAKA